jgi:hypothetical protein
MSGWLMRVIKAEAKRLIELAGEDDELRADLRALAQEILAATDARQSNAAPTIRPARAPDTTEGEDSPSTAALSEVTGINSPGAEEPRKELTLGSSGLS